MPQTEIKFTNALIITSAFLIGLLFSPSILAQDSPSKTPDPLSMLGYRATEGAAAGYVPDKACSTCHMELYLSYQKVGMAQSFKRPDQAEAIEDFGREFYHEPSKRYYRIDRKDDKWIFHRYQHDAEKKPINEYQVEIDWVLGSGNRARSYLYQNEWGEMYMVPLGWYSEGKEWGMSPGFEAEVHMGIHRPVHRQCMFCHNGLPEVPTDSDLHWENHLFPKELPQGTGCQRCHGPGAEHIRAGLTGKPHETIRSLIVNPRKLPPEERDSVCFQCHMLPSVAMIGLRRFDRKDYSYRPGQRLAEYMVHMEVDEEGISREDSFEINHHGYRFWQSTCFKESKGELACISCHDPHVKPLSKDFRAHVSTVCLGCHESQKANHKPAIAQNQDCVGCHMPTTRTRDVVLVTMTDHRIRRGPFDHEKMVQPIEKKVPIITNMEVLPWGKRPTGDEAEIYRIATALRRGQPSAAPAMKNILLRTQYENPVPYIDLLETEIKEQNYVEAEKIARFMLRKRPDIFRFYSLLGIAQMGQQRRPEAIVSLKKSIEMNPTPEAHYNLGVVAFADRQDDLALQHLNKALEMRPNNYRAILFKGRIFKARGKSEQARDAFIRCLQLEPTLTPAYAELVKILRKTNNEKEAERYLEVGLRFALKPEELKPLRKTTP